jgi:hypothetical protein
MGYIRSKGMKVAAIAKALIYWLGFGLSALFDPA